MFCWVNYSNKFLVKNIMVDSFAVRLKGEDGDSDATASSLKDWKAIAVDFLEKGNQLRGNVSSENYTIF